MKIGLYNPYLSSVLGGGERHFLSIAQCLSKDHQVDIIIDKLDPALKSKLKNTFNLRLDNINFIESSFSNLSILARINFTKAYDIFYYMTDGSFFISRAKKNIVHFQIPFKNQPTFIQRLKLSTWSTITANSQFTKDWIEKIWKFKVKYVHRGSIDTKNIKPAKKQNTILSVGRFISDKNDKHCKRQDFLVSTFKKMCDQGLNDWKLVLHGNFEKGTDNQLSLKKVKKISKGYPVSIHHNSSFKELVKAYASAKIYWHAAGYGVDQTKNPQAVEHLGLTTAEAQSAGVVPVVINKGGQPEVVSHNLDGFLWETQTQLITQTLQLIKDQKLWQKISITAIKNSKSFSEEKFNTLTNKIFTI